MTTQEIDKLRYPIGIADLSQPYSRLDINQKIQQIGELPTRILASLMHLDTTQYDAQYRPNGWTVRQIVHHLADSHMNGYIRMKSAMTEPTPTIKPYLENLWAVTPDNALSPLVSAELLVALHARWSFWLGTLKDEDFTKDYFHPEASRHYKLFESVRMYAWHGLHHLEHIKTAVASSK